MSIESPNNDAYWLALNAVSSIGPSRFKRLLAYFGSAKNAWEADAGLLRESGIEPAVIETLIDARRTIDPETIIAGLDRLNIQYITMQNDAYPSLLKQIYAAPPVLYYRGAFETLSKYPFGIVGSRKISAYGKTVTEDFSAALAASGLTIISGLALGIDSVAHRAAINAAGRTAAILGSGLDCIYPVSNHQLADAIVASGGALVSEFPPGTRPFKSNFPQRNRIIAGASLGLLVTEASEVSGSLITAQFALEQNRDVFAVPGDLYRNGSQGTNKLIATGAQLVMSPQDIIDALSLYDVRAFEDAKKAIPETETEKIILQYIDGPTHVDKIVQLSRLTISEVNATISVMEMKGLLKHLGQQTYTRFHT